MRHVQVPLWSQLTIPLQDRGSIYKYIYGATWASILPGHHCKYDAKKSDNIEIHTHKQTHTHTHTRSPHRTKHDQEQLPQKDTSDKNRLTIRWQLMTNDLHMTTSIKQKKKCAQCPVPSPLFPKTQIPTFDPIANTTQITPPPVTLSIHSFSQNMRTAFYSYKFL